MLSPEDFEMQTKVSLIHIHDFIPLLYTLNTFVLDYHVGGMGANIIQCMGSGRSSSPPTTWTTTCWLPPICALQKKGTAVLCKVQERSLLCFLP